MKRRLITLWRIFEAGAINFLRNISLAIAAMAVMVVTLTIILFSVITNATFSHTISQFTNKIDISVYLQSTVSDTQAEQFVARIKAQPQVSRVVYLDQAQALKAYYSEYNNNPTLIKAANEASGNPIPATIQIYLKNLDYVSQVKTYLVKPANAALQTANSPSYNGNQKEAIDNIAHATDILRKIGIIAVAAFAVISALIIFNTIQMAIFNRRDEITIMRLLGASTNYIRGPYVVESAIYGILSGFISVGVIYAAFRAASNALQASSLGLLDINYANHYFDSHLFQLLTMQIAIGIIIGTVSSIIATRRYLKFKTK